MYVCDFYQTLSVKGDYKGSSSVYITYAEEEIFCQKYYCPRISIRVIASLGALIE
jgi:hypothetical protein